MKIYVMSDIHGCIDALLKALEKVDLSDGESKVVFLGDYIDRGLDSYSVLHTIFELQKQYGERVVALMGNHEQMFLQWLYDPDEMFWLDTHTYAFTLGSFLNDEQMNELGECLKGKDLKTLNELAKKLIKDNRKELIRWLKKLPYYYETDKQIFVHAGIYEGEGEYWKLCTSEDEMCWMRPSHFGKFYKDVIAGHTGTYAISHNKHFHDIYFDGASHYFVDGTVYLSKKLPVLVYDADEDKYFQAKDGGLVLVKAYKDE